MRRWIAALIVAALAGCGGTDEPIYSGAWRTGGPEFMGIAKTLAAAGITGCGEFHYKMAGGRTDSGDALVYCTADGKKWDAYMVFYKIDRVHRTTADDPPPY